MTDLTSSQLLQRYGAMCKLSQQMLELAKQHEWERLIEHEHARAAIMEELKQLDMIVWQAPDSTEKEQLIHAILAIDTEIKSLTEAQMYTLQQNLGSINTEKKLQKAYYSG